MRFDIITIFPHIFDSYFNESIIKRAQKKKLVQIKIHNLRDFTKDKSRSRSNRGSSTRWSGHKKVDDKPYGGGAGMVLVAEPILRAVQKIKLKTKNQKLKTKIILFSAKGKQFNQKMAYDWSRKYNNIILISGRYEGIDERVGKALRDSGFTIQEVSIGPYVLTDGDAPVMVAVSAITRLVPGAINFESLEEESYFNHSVKKEESRNIKTLEYPHYTRPENLLWGKKKYAVPKILLSGNHREIEAWRIKHRRRR